MLITCKCLNVSISEENGHLDNLELEKLGLCSSEQRDPFFRERLGSVCDWKVRCEETSLVETRQVGAWLVHRCLACQTFTHATLMQAPCQMLVNADLGMTEEAIQQLRRCDQYSPVFNMVVKEPADGSVTKRPSPTASHPSAGNLSRKLTRALQARVDAVEEAVRLFREKQYADFEEFREKAHKDHRILSGILFQAEHMETSMANNNNRNIIPQKSNETLPQLINARSRQQPAFGNPFPVNKPRNGSVKNMADLGSYKEDSLDSEGIFDLEGMDVPHNGLISDAYDSDTDDSVSRDEGIHITREAAQQWGSSIAKSLPVNVPAFTQFHDISQDRLDQHGEEPQDIAASIKALARSVHGDVFGDLPRPRFCTQI